ncbi:Piso0_003474 [Millerozyma farinosa CBS 7064]|uniref:Piso0_003474 protein n=1 Tax=Pichia sorbitophila (strain ATCC MYA-4447 / BCRC 22081 / CBS 7064 / NBRC 10061 / NRRL Y-12695) TaxID=559304 RepID=G8YJ63_PICSO|nr:Piso0_003474 [Millerozyma farinosa CBS 7064]CCE81123.1 Piso0_003474 [Millerozyma farinosa CBS 7064]
MIPPVLDSISQRKSYTKKRTMTSQAGHGLINTARLKTSLKMAISKLKFAQDKKSALNKQLRRQLADTLRQGKETSATIRVENIIRDDIYVELLEYLELYCELLLTRISLILDPARAEIDDGLKEAAYSVIYASQYADLRELNIIKEILISRYGPELIHEVSTNEGNVIPDRIITRCKIEPPSEKLVTLYLCEIAKAYKVPYSGLQSESDPESIERDTESAEQNDTGDSTEKDNNSTEVKPAPETQGKKVDDFDSLKARFAALKGAPKS